jgi:NADH dehydrogenase [ubiquinone] 1 alpha subcomplex assembly factor 1
MWANNNQARRDLLQWAKSSRTRAGVLMVVAVVTIASTSSSPSSSTTTTSTSNSSSYNNQGGFLPSLYFWKRTGKDNVTSMQQKIPVAVPKYDRAATERRTVSALSMLQGQNLNWFRLDDGIMGGQSSSEATVASTHDNGGILHFTGTINTNGGGFTSIRATIPNGSLTRETTGIKLRFRGDGKTYKLLLSDGSRGGGGARQTPSWQANLPTKKSSANSTADEWQEMIIPLSSFIPNVGVGRNRQIGNLDQYRLDPVEMKQIGLMLSLLLADGQPNPQATFGSGVFDFSLQVQSIEPVME